MNDFPKEIILSIEGSPELARKFLDGMTAMVYPVKRFDGAYEPPDPIKVTFQPDGIGTEYRVLSTTSRPVNSLGEKVGVDVRLVGFNLPDATKYEKAQETPCVRDHGGLCKTHPLCELNEKAVGYLQDIALMSPSEKCSKHGLQCCHACEAVDCADNTTPHAPLLKAVKELLDDVQSSLNTGHGSGSDNPCACPTCLKLAATYKKCRDLERGKE